MTMRSNSSLKSPSPFQSICFATPRPKEEIYDLKLDPFELKNLATDERYSPLLHAMQAALSSMAS